MANERPTPNERRAIRFDRCHASVIIREPGHPPRRVESGECTECSLERKTGVVLHTQTFAGGLIVTTEYSEEKALGLAERLTLMVEKR